LEFKDKKSFSILIVLGTRPEAIKLCPLIIEFQNYKNIQTKVLLTGQHIEMVSQVLDIFGIKEDFNLQIMKKKQSLGYITQSVIAGLEEHFLKNKPNLVIVQGDTTTAFAAALISFYFGVKVAHVEAGLRTNNIDNPFPEEANRKMITQLASFHFAPTKIAFENLISTKTLGVIKLTGNTVIDALMIIKKKFKFKENQSKKDSKKIIFTSIHRRENWGKNIRNISYGIKEIADKYTNVKIILPMHKNETVRKPIQDILNNHPRIELTEPLNYKDLVSTLIDSYFVITDSGGIQEEAPALGKPVLVLRDSTERPEGIEAGTAKLVGANTENIFNFASRLLDQKTIYNEMARSINPYGDGEASKRIVKVIFESFGLGYDH